MTTQRRPDHGSEYGRLLAQRDRLIASGVDPAELEMPLPPPPEPLEMSGPEYPEPVEAPRSSAVIVWIVAGVLFWLVVGLVWTWLT